MSTPGWYPDPGGAAGRFRYWDGSTWSAETTASPTAGPGVAPARRRRVGPWIAAAVVVIVVALVATAIVRSLADRGPTVSDPVPAISTTGSSGGDGDSTPSQVPTPSPTPLPSTSPTPSPTVVTPSTTPSPPDVGKVCPVADEAGRQQHPDDGRVHGGGLSFPAPRGYVWHQQDDLITSTYSWAYDVGETGETLMDQDEVWYAVGAVSTADGFDSPKTAATLSMDCTLASFYANATGVRTVSSRRTTVEGHPAWTLASEIAYVNGRGPSTDLVWITVVDGGAENSLAFFWGNAPTDHQQLVSLLQRTASQLRVDQ